MNKIIKIFKDETNIYSEIYYVNTVIFRGRIYGDFKNVGQCGIKFSLQLSNGKKRRGAAANSRPDFLNIKNLITRGFILIKKIQMNGTNRRLPIAQHLAMFQNVF